MSDFDLPEPTAAEPKESADFSLPQGLEPSENELSQNKKSKKWIWIIVIALVVIMCCCCLVLVAVFSSEGGNLNNLMNDFSALLLSAF